MYFYNSNVVYLTIPDITAYPESVNVLEGVKDDVRTPAKLIDGVNDTEDGRHMWLVPIFPDLVTSLVSLTHFLLFSTSYATNI